VSTGVNITLVDEALKKKLDELAKQLKELNERVNKALKELESKTKTK